MSQNSGLTVRHFERESVELPVDFVICEEHRAQVRFSTSSAAADQHTIQGLTTDVSPGGMGLRMDQFIPRMCEGTLRVFSPARARATPGIAGTAATATATARAGSGPAPGTVIFEHRAKVRRVSMQGGTASYDIGVEFVAADNDLAQRIDDLARLATSPASPATGHGRPERGSASHA